MNKILVIDDDIAVQTSLSLMLRQEGFQVKTTSSPVLAMDIIEEFQPHLIILDLNFSIETSGDEGIKALKIIRGTFPDIAIILLTGWGTINLAVEGMKLGAKDFMTKPWQNDYIIQSINTILNLSQQKVQSLNRKKLDQQYQFEHIVGEDPKLLEILETIGRVGITDAPVLITGESGTGKELIAEAIHQNSKRKNKPFIKVNLGGVSASLFESELFGHIRGAFTDAKSDRIGRFELANKGTIFLDEIGDLDLSSQVKLLRVLQDRTFEPLGSSKSKTVDVRVICATNRNLEEMVANNTFREDLFYRINLISVKLPALRERPDDIASLAIYFVNNLKTIYERPYLTIAPKAINWLKSLPLPGNIRQLKNLVEKTILLTPKDELAIEDFQKNISINTIQANKNTLPEVGTMTLDEIELLMIQRAMAFHQNKISKVARSLGITRFALYRRLEKFNIPFVE
ncbi:MULTISPECIES: sigma-54 dependent transcriptional regulator [unclassified Arcicella]|uniref:sigma-54-dependent transcriptional regulator n=1 Tax=unclassified Arcicella TaxID=2644986 RepID=UPI00285A4AB5|nr:MULTISPECIES: sigma-54 dependent transcriptional regulator [unclassified Arcicella]MDR6560174.1 DNA-binding NtrC family response regulator [Arcicella sp. BE51]MDR6810219.1 DNA-binding NtrC family response regulator [Arcicella sp. BE140]MDR6821569.1 DNA-binding NtrC family response regulator [Arcicella sp. BE139]